MKKIIVITVAIAAILISLFLFARTQSPALPSGSQTKPESQSNGLPDIPNPALEDYNSNEVRLRNFEGRVLVLNSWASWCPFCLDELVDFKTAQKEFGDRVVIVAINREETLN